MLKKDRINAIRFAVVARQIKAQRDPIRLVGISLQKKQAKEDSQDLSLYWDQIEKGNRIIQTV